MGRRGDTCPRGGVDSFRGASSVLTYRPPEEGANTLQVRLELGHIVPSAKDTARLTELLPRPHSVTPMAVRPQLSSACFRRPLALPTFRTLPGQTA